MTLPPEIEAWTNLLLGQTLGGQVLTEYINHGSFGIVFEGRDSSTDQRVAVKVLLPLGHSGDPAIEFQSEGELLAKCRKSSGVVTLLATGAENVPVTVLGGATAPVGIQFHVLEHAGGNLEELLESAEKRAKVGWPDRLSLWRDAILGIHQLHLKGITHRDLKSSNCLLFETGRDKLTCKVADLGRGRDLNRPARFPSIAYVQGRGDLRFAPPEFLYWQGRDDPVAHKSADLYGLGSLLFELATGHGITGASLGPIKPMLDQGFDDYRNGRVRDLASFRPAYRQSLYTVYQELPAAIRHEAVGLIAQLCDPVPSERQPKRGPGKRGVPEHGLHWLLRRADILQRRLAHCSGGGTRPTSRSLSRSI